MSKSKNPPKSADTPSAQLRWFIVNDADTPTEISRRADIHHSTVFRFIHKQRPLSPRALDALCKALKLRLVRATK